MTYLFNPFSFVRPSVRLSLKVRCIVKKPLNMFSCIDILIACRNENNLESIYVLLSMYRTSRKTCTNTIIYALCKKSLPPFPHYSPFFRRFSSRAKIARVEAFMGLGVFFAAVADRKKPDEKYRKVLCRSIRYSLITRSLVN